MPVNRFREVYSRKLTEAVKINPKEYAYSVNAVPVVAERMIAALIQGTASIGPCVRATCRELEIKSNIESIQGYLS